jgi:hypothetical protein
MEKRGDINEDTPQHCCGEKSACDQQGQPTDKEAADQLQSSPVNDAVDAVAERTAENNEK